MSLRCLFIKPKMIGDALLLTPTLQAVRRRHPEAVIDVLVRRGTEAILAGCPALDRILLTASPHTDGARRWLDLWRDLRDLRRTRYDWVFECSDSDRGRFLAGLARTRHRVFNRFELEHHQNAVARWGWLACSTDTVYFDWRDHHASAGHFLMAREFLDLPGEPPPLDYAPQVFDPAAAGWELPAGFRLSPNRLILHAGTRLPSKAWPADRWEALLRALAPRFDQVFLSAGPSPEEAALTARWAALDPARIFRPARPLPWTQLAALLQGARLFLGVDTAAMHLAQACRCPSLVVWGPTCAIIFGPRRPDAVLVLGNRVARPPFGRAEGHVESRLASANEVATVLAAAREILGTGASPPGTAPNPVEGRIR